MTLSEHPDTMGSAAGPPPTPKFLFLMCFFATISGFLFGYDTGIISGSMLLIRPYFLMDTVWTEVVVSATVASAALFSIVAGYLMDYIGRRKTLMMGSVTYTVGVLVMSLAPNKATLLFGRLIVGIAIGTYVVFPSLDTLRG